MLWVYLNYIYIAAQKYIWRFFCLKEVSAIFFCTCMYRHWHSKCAEILISIQHTFKYFLKSEIIVPFKIGNIPNCMYDALHFQTEKKTRRNWKFVYYWISFYLMLWLRFDVHIISQTVLICKSFVLQPKLQAFLLQKKKKKLKKLLVATCRVTDTESCHNNLWMIFFFCIVRNLKYPF